MQQQWALVLFLLALGMFLIPLWPAILEMRRKGSHVLAIDREDDGSSAYAALLALKNSGEDLAQGNLYVQSEGRMNTAACTGDLHIGSGASINVARAKDIFLNAQATVNEVASATQTLWVQPNCQFRWLDAPTVQFTATGGNALAVENDLSALSSARGEGGLAGKRKFTRIEGNWQPGPDTEVHGDYVVTADVELGRDCAVFGNIKAYGSVRLREKSFVRGSVFAEGDVELSPAAQVLGVVCAGQKALLHRGSVVGRISQLSSVSAPSILAHAGARVHGSVRARNHGRSCD
jgi:hypothetical protein